MSRFVEVAFNLPIKKLFTYSIPMDSDAAMGQRVIAPFGKKKLTGLIVSTSDEKPSSDYQIKEIDRIIDSAPLIDSNLLSLARWMEDIYMCSLGEALSVIVPGGKKEKEPDVVFSLDEALNEKNLILSNEQAKAVTDISKETTGTFYIYGITGSGKTEVYLRIAHEVIKKGKSVIYLVPEISLTHQIHEKFVGEFGDIAILHSGLSPSQKLREWIRIKNREVSFVVGARSAIFAPVPELGLIVIDEEHDGSYKSSQTPRYHTRQVASHRAETEKCILLLGSATPSIEAYHRFSTGQLSSFTLGTRLTGGELPKIEIVDLKGTTGPLSNRLIEEMKRVHSQKRQTILFLNRRGFAYFFHCRLCGFEMKCKSCSVALTFHKKSWSMVCHYCGYSTKPISTCPSCGALDVGYSGFGTEKIEEEVQTHFPDLIVSRVDTDSVKKKHVLRDIISRFKKGEIDVLLGTQMVAKGFNFPGVMLVGIINADTGLHMPDFRAFERTFNLIVQVSGRAGRIMPDGKVIVQTLNPENEAILLASFGKLKTFYENELERRRELGFPPFSRLIRFVFRSKNAKKAFDTAQSVCDRIEKETGGFAEVLGPAECPIAMISNNHRVHIILRTQEFRRLHTAVKMLFPSLKIPQDVYCEVDVDPISLL